MQLGKMSSQYPVLDNRPIDQWKVTELKEELKRRKLITKGLKDDLIRRLDEALHMERDAAEEEAAVEENDSIKEEVGQETHAKCENAKTNLVETQLVEDNGDSENKTQKVDESATTIEIDDERDGKAKLVETQQVEDTRDDGKDKTLKVDDSAAIVDNDDKRVDVKTKLVESQMVDDDRDYSENRTEKVDESQMVENTRDDGKDKTQKVDDTVAIVDNDDERVDVKTKPVESQMVEDARDHSESRAEKVESQMVEDARDHSESRAEKVDESATAIDINDSSVNADDKMQDGKLMGVDDPVQMDGDPLVLAVSVETSITVTETVVTQIASSREESKDSENQVKNEDPKHPHKDDVLNMFDSNNQVSEVSSVLGLKVNESISSDSISINEKNELKDYLNANNFHELEVVKPEMVEPSSNDVPPKGGDIPALAEPMQCDTQRSVEEIDDTNATNMDLSKKIDSADAGSSEKVNLDRSPGDDSMEEDVLESKHMDSNHNSDDMKDRNESHSHIVMEESPVDTTGHPLSSDKDISTENNNSHAAPAEKRKFEGQVVVENNEPPKRQRRWNSEAPKVSEPPTSTLTPPTPKDTFWSTIPKRNFNRSDSTVSSGADTPRERVVPPSPRPPTTSLRIDRFLRPFTLKAVQELLAKTGTVSSFWMDHIKTHCYVTYSSVEEAKETRNAVYNLQWPTNGGHLLVAEFVDPQEVKIRAEAPAPAQPAAPPVNNSPTTPAAPTPFQSKPSPRQHVPKEQLPPPPSLPPPPPLSNPPPARERVQLPPPPPLPTKADLPILTLDDLFKKTKATPRIYYLPLSEEQVAAKIAAKSKNSK